MWLRNLLPLALLLASSGCGGGERKTGGRASVERAEKPLSGLELSSDDADPIDGKRPKLYVSCDVGSLFVSFGLVRGSPSPPPLRGVFGTVTIDSGAPLRLEMGYLPPASWTPRSQHPNQEGGLTYAEEQRLVLAIARAKTVQLTGLYGHAPTPVTWRIDLPRAERERFAALCSERSPDEQASEEAEFRRERARDPVVQDQRRRARETNRRMTELYELRKQRCRNFEAEGHSSAMCPPEPPVLVPVDHAQGDRN